jgi:hypothetical protein
MVHSFEMSIQDTKKGKNTMRILTILPLLAGLAACGTPEDTPDPLVFEEIEVTRSAVDTDLPVEAATEFEAETSDVVASLETPDPSVEEAPVDAGPVEPAIPLTTYALRRGETLAHFARWAELPVEDIAETSELPLDGAYAVGTEIALSLTPELRAQVETRRDAHHRTRAERYLASRGATETEFYSVKTGDSAWTIANDRHGMPVWLLESLNPSADLERLRPGDALLVPVFTDIVAEAPSTDGVE